MAVAGRAGLPHGTVPGYLFLFPLLGAATAPRTTGKDPVVRLWWSGSAITVLTLVFVMVTQTLTGWWSRVMPALLRRGDPTMELLDWRELGPTLTSRGLLDAGRFVVAANWIDAGKVGYARGPKVPVLCLGSACHHCRDLYDPASFSGRDAIWIVRARNAAPAVAEYAPFFAGIDSVPSASISRAGRTLV